MKGDLKILIIAVGVAAVLGLIGYLALLYAG